MKLINIKFAMLSVTLNVKKNIQMGEYGNKISTEVDNIYVLDVIWLVKSRR